MNKGVWFFLILCLLSYDTMSSQISHPQNNEPRSMKSDFLDRVQFGGGLGLSLGSNYTDIAIAPSGIYNVTDQVAFGAGLQFNYVKSKNYFESASYGINLIGLFTPIPEVQLSLELEQLRVNKTLEAYNNQGYYLGKFKDNFWNTGLFIGAGYRTNNVTVGVRYNVLYKTDNYVYSQSWMPFVRVYF